LGAAEELLELFELTWRRGTPPRIEAFLLALPADRQAVDDPLRRELLEEMVKIDLEYRWQRAGNRALVPASPSKDVNGRQAPPDAGALPEQPHLEDYVARFPELGPVERLSVELIGEEYRVRQRWGDRPGHAGYAARFAQHGETLRVALVRIDGELGPATVNERPMPPERSAQHTPPSAVPVLCPHCHHPLELAAASPQEIPCPSCGGTFRVEARSPSSDQAAQPPVPRVGRYELLELLGTGGFGSVWRARDTELDREVAVKLPRSGRFTSPEEEERFLREARSTAQLQHPGIVSVHDVGRDNNIVYLVAELVRGVSLEERLSSGRLSFRGAAELMAQVAEALDYAHQQGVVHRDLKPANIMLSSEGCGPVGANDSAAPTTSPGPRITDHGQPRIMDFGLAKRKAGEITITLEGHVLGTPAYMSPEQIRHSHAVDGRSDVYSLGVILYEVLTGELPFRGTTQMVLQQVLLDEPRPPRRLNDKIPRDLETIMLKCLAKEPTRRYRTAGELAADLRRWLAGEPIQARPVRSAERLWRWCRRKPAVASLAALLLLAVVVGFAAVTWQWRRAVESNRRADHSFHQAREAVNKFYTRVGRETLFDTPQLQPLRKDLLEIALAYESDFLRQRGDDPTVQFHVAVAYRNVGSFRLEIGTREGALECFQKSCEILEQLVRADPANPQYRNNLAYSYNNLGLAYDGTGQLDKAFQYYEQARAIAYKLTEDDPDQREYQNTLGTAYLNLGAYYGVTGQGSQESRSYQLAQEIYDKLSKDHPSLVECQVSLAQTYYALAYEQRARGAPLAEVMRSFEQARDIFARLVSAFPTVPRFRNYLAVCLTAIGDLQKVMFLLQPEKARSSYEQAIAMWEKLVQENPTVSHFRNGLAMVHNNLGNLDRVWRRDKSMQSFETARGIWEEMVKADPDNLELRSNLATCCANIGLSLSLRKQREAAVGSYEEAIRHRRIAYNGQPEANRQTLSDHYCDLAKLQHALGRLNEAAEAALERQKLWPTNPNQLYEVARELALCVPLVGKDKDPLLPEEQAQRRRYSDQALDVLRQAVANGYKDIEQLKTASDLDPLRSREDFKKLRTELEEKVTTGAK
jgi:tetratricopeptide (TPR) repeat protein/tRNA A-37 threonylcarbamoyl transferase component Bud32